MRRATLDDLPTLISLWKLEQIPYADLEKRFKEFQVAESESGEILGAVGVQVAGIEARLHSEAFSNFEQADELRQAIWARIQVMAENQGWVRVWTELTSQTWRQIGFDPPNPEQWSKLPESFAHGGTGHWLLVQLREERAAGPSLDAEFEMLRMSHQAENERLAKRARQLRIASTLIAAAVLFFIVWWGVKLVQMQGQAPRKVAPGSP